MHIMIITGGFYKSERLGGGTADLINGLNKSIIVANDGRFHGSLAMKHMHKHDAYSRRIQKKRKKNLNVLGPTTLDYGCNLRIQIPRDLKPFTLETNRSYNLYCIFLYDHIACYEM